MVELGARFVPMVIIPMEPVIVWLIKTVASTSSPTAPALHVAPMLVLGWDQLVPTERMFTTQSIKTAEV